MAEKRAVTRMLAVVLVGLTLGATALAAPTRAVREHSAAKEVSFLERLPSLFRMDDHEEWRSPKGAKAQDASLVTRIGSPPHHSSLRTLDAQELE